MKQEDIQMKLKQMIYIMIVELESVFIQDYSHVVSLLAKEYFGEEIENKGL
jgi:hypothetical protein